MRLFSSLLLTVTLASGEIAFMRDGHVRLLNFDTGEERALYETGYDRPLVWSPDGERLLVWKHSEIGWDLWSLGSIGEEEPAAINLTNIQSGGCRSASFSPDGERIAFMRDDPPGVWVMNADGSDMRRLSEAGHRDAVLRWSPDGTKLLYVVHETEEDSVRPHIHVLDVQTREDRFIAMGAVPRWVNDESILFAVLRDGNIVLLVRDLDGSSERVVSGQSHDAWSPALSPDRVYVAYLAREADGSRVLTVARANGTGSVRTLFSRTGLTGAPTWSADSRKIAVSVVAEDENGLWIVDVRTRASHKIADGVFHWLAWRPSWDEAE